MAIVIGLAKELDDAATYLELHARDQYDNSILFFPRAVNLLRERAKRLRGERQAKRKPKTVRAWVGGKQRKENEISIKRERIERD